MARDWWITNVDFAYHFCVQFLQNVRRNVDEEIPNSPAEILRAKQELENQGLTN